MKKIKINMLSKADSVKGQGVGSAYLEQVKLIKEGASDMFDVKINSLREADIFHHHTIEPMNLLRMMTTNAVNVAYVHFLPDTLDGSIKLNKIAFDVFKSYVLGFYKAADHLVVVNPIFIKDLVELGIDREKLHYIPNYVSKDKFFPRPRKDMLALRKELNIKDDSFVVLGVGQVQTRKGVLDFVEVAKNMPDVTFVWCGGFSFGMISDGYKELKEIYENPPKNVKFLGIIPREKMNDMYNMADLLFMPSFNELFPMSILEASNSHKPILLRNLELYEDILFKKYLHAEDVKGFIEKITSLKTNKEVYKTSSNWSKEISEFYSKENVLEIWKKFYLSILEEKKD